MPGSAKQIAVPRDLKRRFHRRRARFWSVLLIVADGLFPITLLFILAPFLWISMFVDEVFISHRYYASSHIYESLFQFVLSLAFAPAFISFGWWMLVNIRDIRNKHVRLAAGYAQSSAEEMLAKAKKTGHQFGLFLRGFETEAASTTYYGSNPEIGSRESEIHARHIEALFVEMLIDEVPLVALANPRDPEPMAGVYRFESVPEKWEQFICELLPDAFPIVMHLTSFTPGITVELNRIRSPIYSAKAVIVVSRNLAIRNSPYGEKLLKFLSGFGHIVFEQIDKDWSRAREVEFHSCVLESLQALELESQGQRIILRKTTGDFKVVTPNRFRRVIDFIKGPALSVSILMLLVLGFMLLSNLLAFYLQGGHLHNNTYTSQAKRFNEHALWLVVSSLLALLGTWSGLVLLVSALKGLAYILGFAQRPGDNKHFPTFSRMVNWAKRYSATPK